MSTFPVAFDATFPGYPYVDNTQYVDETQANSWVLAIQAIEATIGYGTGGTPTSPLYSSTYATTYATVTARIAALENNVVNGGIKLNSANANIQSVGAGNIAGSTGLAADAGHVHAGQSAASLLNIGTIFMWPGLAATYPLNCFSCNGQLLSTSTYATLFGIIGYTYGGSGPSFALPNFNDRHPIGPGGTIAAAAGSTGGSTTITTANLPAHNHPASASDSGHAHVVSNPAPFAPVVGNEGVTGTWAAAPNGSQYGVGGLGLNVVTLSTAAASANITASTSNTGNGTPYTQPFLGIYFLIRAL